MRVVHLSIKCFRGIRALDWAPPSGVVCLVGAGDSAKTTILESVGYALWPRSWLQIFDCDFHNASTDDPLEIRVTVVDVPAALLSQDKFGLDQRGWTTDEKIRDEPDDGDTPALTVRLRVDDSMDPAWTVVSDRNPEGRPISSRDREALRAVWLSDDCDRHLSWMRGSALGHLMEPEAVTSTLSKAHRTARDAVASSDLSHLATAATRAGEWGVRYGAQLKVPLGVGVDPRQLSVGGGALSLRQDDGVPARAVGLGSRRLLALAIQRQAVGAGVLTMVDEVEHGLEPHRLRHLLNELRGSGNQVMVTTHSPTALAELGVEGVAVVRRNADGCVSIVHPDPSLQGVVRRHPEALLARRIVVCEGATEWGIGRGLVDYWDKTAPEPLAALGTVFVNCDGSRAPERAAGFRQLGFPCLLWCDADRDVSPSADELEALGVAVVQWAESKNTEERLMADVPEPVLAELWAVAADEKGEPVIADHVGAQMGVTGRAPRTWAEWCRSYSTADLRPALGRAANKGRWFKSNSSGRKVGDVLGPILRSIPTTDLARATEQVRRFAYAD